MAAVVNVPLLTLADQRVAAVLAGQTAAVHEVVLQASRVGLAEQDPLDAFKKLATDQRFVNAFECLVRGLDVDDPNVERVLQQLRHSIRMELVAAASPQAQPVELGTEANEVVPSGAVQIESFPNKGSRLGIERLGFARAIVDVTERCRHRVQSLLEPPPKAFYGLFPQISYVVGGNHRLDVGGQASAAGVQVQRFVREVNFSAVVDEFTEVGPVAEVAGAAINLVDDHAARTASLELLDHLAEKRPATLGRRFQFLEPSGDLQAVPLGVLLNCGPLLLERDALSLPGR